MATPDQAGLAALVLSHQYKLTNRVLKVKEYLDLIHDHIEDLGPRGHDREYGHGFFDIQSYLDSNSSPSPAKPKPTKPAPGNPLDGYQYIGGIKWGGKHYIIMEESK